MKAYFLTLFDGEHAEIMEIYQRAKDLGTDTTYWAYNIAWLYLGPQGRFDEAIEILELAKLKDPLAFMPRNALAVINLAAGKVSEAGETRPRIADHARYACRCFYGWWKGTYSGGWYAKGGGVARHNRPRQSRRGAQHKQYEDRVLSCDESPDALQDLLELIMAHRNKGEYVFPTVVANIYIALQDYDTALDWLADAVDARDPQFLANAAVNLRRHPVVGQHPAVCDPAAADEPG